MLSRINTEHEVRLITDINGLKSAEQWVLKIPYPGFGMSETRRSHFYYDLSNYTLAKKNASFRQSVGKFAYCLKYPVSGDDIVLTRREVFWKASGKPLDLSHPYHRRVGLTARLLPMLSSTDPIPTAVLDDFQARIRIDCQRRHRIVLYPDGVDRMLAVAFDSVSAYDLQGERPKLIRSWCEIEIETVWAFPERVDVAVELARKLEKRGCRIVRDCKYHLAVSPRINHANT